MTLHLTIDKTNQLLDEAVAEKGADYIYTDENGVKAGGGAICMYTHLTPSGDLTPGCLVGDVLSRFGVPLDVLGARGDGREAEDDVLESAGNLFRALARDGYLTLDEGSHRMLGVAQEQQDIGSPWGEAVSFARRSLLNPDNDGEEL